MEYKKFRFWYETGEETEETDWFGSITTKDFNFILKNYFELSNGIFKYKDLVKYKDLIDLMNDYDDWEEVDCIKEVRQLKIKKINEYGNNRK